MSDDSKVMDLEILSEVLEHERSQGKTLVLCHGVFDLMHPGHIRHFKEAKRLGDLLIVSITADAFVGKGPGRPAFNQDWRAESLAALEDIDYVTVVYGESALAAISALKPNFYAKGFEYSDESSDSTGRIKEERELVESQGGSIAFTNDVVFSSSSLINSFLPSHSAAAHSWIQEFKKTYSAEDVVAWLDRLGSLSVLIVGETIFDVYTECQSLGKASKDPVLAMNRLDSDTHAGGVLAIASHCAGLGADVSLVSGIHSDDRDYPVLQDLKARRVRVTFFDSDPRPTIRKERFVDANTQVRVLELYHMRDEPLDVRNEETLIGTLGSLRLKADMVLVADYGHGLISDSTVELLCDGSSWIAVNAQANAGNYGFNSIQRYHDIQFATLNGQEANLESRRRHTVFDSYIPELLETLRAHSILVTQGASGLDLFRQGDDVYHAPALAPYVTDRVGAGDAVLAVTALLARVGAPPAVIGFVGNLVGAWAVSFLGNTHAIELGTLKKQVISTLK